MSNYQLSLALSLPDDATFANFTAGFNQPVYDAIMGLAQGDKADNFVYLCGAYGSGRSHLLQAACHARHEANRTAIYIPLGQGEFGVDIFDGLENISLVCIDDIDSVLGNARWDEALFHFYNRAQHTQVQLLVSAKQLPSQLENCLPDLRSRLCWGLVFQLSPLSDAQKLTAVRHRACLRGFSISDEVASFLLRHFPRDTHALFALLDALDQKSLQEQRLITIPFVKSVISEGRVAGWL